MFVGRIESRGKNPESVRIKINMGVSKDLEHGCLLTYSTLPV